ncbi:hypothetical protein ACROYT_G041858 [Oculina patagonica]
MNFIDFEKAFDIYSVDRNIIWQLMYHYGIPSKFIKLIQDLYQSSSCHVIHNGKLTESFEMSTGVRQGCLLSPMIFIMVVDWIMREVEDQGSIITVTGGTEEDVKCRIGKARLAFNMLRPVWNASSISTKTKLRIFTTNVKATLLFGSQTWKVTQALSNKLQSFVNKCLRKILKTHWPEKISNKELWSRTGQEHIPAEIARRKWAWIGHTLRKPGTDTTKQALKWNPQGKERWEDLLRPGEDQLRRS